MVAECHGGGGGDFLIKLFGKTIPVPEPESGDAKDVQQSSSSSSTEQDQDVHAPENAAAHPDTSDASPQPEVVDAEDPKSSPETHQNPGDGDGDAASQREKLRKPDKVLPCPRCNSMDTKFCYFNNYNVNQPRHFCKNCQRYWTAGGAMRNVPVGAGRRKNKNAVAASHFFQSVRDALPAYGGDTLIKTTNNGTVLSFGHGGAPPAPAPACLDLAEQLNRLAPVRNRNTGAGADTGPCSEGSTNSNRDDKSCVDEQPSAANGEDGSLHLQQQHPATATMNVWTPYSCAPPPAAYFSSGIAIPIYPAAPGYWGCMVPGAWSLPWAVQQPPPPSSSSPATTTTSSSGAAESHTLGLGKHPRDRNREGDDDGRSGSGSAHGNNGAPKVWAPKTIRIDNVDEVARSSIWSLIGIRGDKTKQQQVDAGGHKQLGMVFEPKREATTNKAMMTSSPLLHANPVALTRSVAFQEGS